MIVVSDTTAISNLLKVGRIDLLSALFGRVIIPPAVRSELLAWHESLPAWLEVIAPMDSARVERFRREIHIGEAEAIALGLELHADWVLVDDSEGRRLAKTEGAHVLGLMGVLLLAKRRGQIPEVRSLMNALIETAGFFLSPGVRDEVLRLAGEAP